MKTNQVKANMGKKKLGVIRRNQVSWQVWSHVVGLKVDQPIGSHGNWQKRQTHLCVFSIYMYNHHTLQ
jgi:hypothetical protein